MVEDLGFTGLSRGDQVLVKNLQDILTDLPELLLDRLTILLDEFDLGLISFRLLLLFDGSDNSPGSSAGTNDVFVGDRKKIPLLDGKLLVGRRNHLHVLDHFYVYDQPGESL